MNLIQIAFDQAMSRESLRTVFTKFEPVVTSPDTFEVKGSPYFMKNNRMLYHHSRFKNM